LRPSATDASFQNDDSSPADRELRMYENLNFLLTNRIPRRWATQFIGWFGRIEQPLVRDLSIGFWSLFSDLELEDARKTKFKSVHDCFTRELKEGARTIDSDPASIVSPCDAIVGACGSLAGTELLQIKGSPYSLSDLMRDKELENTYCNGRYATLRLTSGMYHRFHAPHDCVVEQVDYISGDTWNVNPIALKRIEKLFCKNERAIIRTRLATTGDLITVVPVAAILVAGIRLHFLDVVQSVKRAGVSHFHCTVALSKGQEMGWFEHGSTIVVFGPRNFDLCDEVREGGRIRMGQALMRRNWSQMRGSLARRDSAVHVKNLAGHKA
jgi:phosphatidylserine decarboxylase